MPASDCIITAIDFEGTGKVAGYCDEPWQIGIVDIHAGNVVTDSIFESLLHIGERPFNRYAPGRHAELRDEISKAPTMQQIWTRLRPRLEGSLLAAHNTATEKRYLIQAFPLHPPLNWIDTLKLSRIAFPSLKSYRLEDLLDRLNLTERVIEILPGRAPHDALYDAVGCAVLLLKILALPGWEAVTAEALAQV